MYDVLLLHQASYLSYPIVHVTSIMHGRIATRRKRKGRRKTDEEKEKAKENKKKEKAELSESQAGITYVVTVR